MNIIIAIFLSENSKGGDSRVWYFINIFVDTTIGMLICYLLVSVLNYFAEQNNWRVSQIFIVFTIWIIF